MNTENNSLTKKILRSGIIGISVSLVALFVSIIAFRNIQFGAFSFSGTIAIFLLMVLISFFWIFCFLLLKPEEKKNSVFVFCAFFAGFLVQFAFSSFLNYIVSMFIYSNFASKIIKFIRAVLIPSLSFFLAFYFFTGRIRKMEDNLENFMFSAFTGIGICIAFCISILFRFNSVSLQFVIFILITKIPLFSLLSACSGMMIKNAENAIQKIIAFLEFPFVLGLEFLIRILFRINVSSSQHIFMDFVIPFSFTILLFILILILSYRKVLNENQSESNLSRFGINAFGMFLIIVFSIAVIQFDSSRTVKIVSPDSKITFKFPSGFEKTKGKSLESILAENQNSKVTFVRKIHGISDSINIEVDFAFPFKDVFTMDEMPFSPVKNCRIYELPPRPPLKDSLEGENFEGSSQKREKTISFLLKKDDIYLVLSFYGYRRNRKYVDDILKLVARSLSKNDGE